MKLKLPSSSAGARTTIVLGTLLAALVTGGWLLQRGTHTGTFTAYEGARLFENVFRHIQNEYVDAVTDSVTPSGSGTANAGGHPMATRRSERRDRTTARPSLM